MKHRVRRIRKNGHKGIAVYFFINTIEIKSVCFSYFNRELALKKKKKKKKKEKKYQQQANTKVIEDDSSRRCG